MDNRSTRGAQTNLKEYPSAAQLKNVTAALSTPASRNQRDREEKIRRSGIPAENPRNNMVATRGWKNARSESRHGSWVSPTVSDVVGVTMPC